MVVWNDFFPCHINLFDGYCWLWVRNFPHSISILMCLLGRATTTANSDNKLSAHWKTQSVNKSTHIHRRTMTATLCISSGKDVKFIFKVVRLLVTANCPPPFFSSAFHLGFILQNQMKLQTIFYFASPPIYHIFSLSLLSGVTQPSWHSSQIIVNLKI